MTTPNVPLLRQTMDEILAHPELHRQSMWVTQTDCGTAYCFAGWACHLSGLEFEMRMGQPTQMLADGAMVSDTARALLGLDLNSAAELFWASNTTADLKHCVDQIAEHGRVVEPIERDDEVAW